MEKIALKPEYRMVCYASVTGFVLSLLFGFLVRNPAAVVLARALISAVIFGGLAYGGLYIISRYIPELVQGKVEGGEENAVDVTISDSTPPESLFDSIAAETGGHLSSLPGSDDTGEQAGSEQPAILPSAMPPTPESEASGAPSTEGLPSLESLFAREEEVSVPEDIERGVYEEKASNVSGGYIEIGKARIPYEPEVLAKAIKKVMKQDEYE